MIDGVGCHLNALDSMLVVGGGARSGTTIMGKIVASMERIEYFFEPPMFIPLFLNGRDTENRYLKTLTDAYFYEELLINSLAGRNLNFNHCDDSFIGNVKEDKEIKSRLAGCRRRFELDELASLSRFSFKSPYAVFFVGQLKDVYKKASFIMMHRSPCEVINSVVAKKWFSNEYLNPDAGGTVHALRAKENIKIPFWVESEDEGFWVIASEVERAIYYYVRVAEEMLKYRSSCLIINYESLLKNPLRVVTSITSRFDLKFTHKTYEVIDSIVVQESTDSSFASSSCNQYWYNRAFELDSALKSCAI